MLSLAVAPQIDGASSALSGSAFADLAVISNPGPAPTSSAAEAASSSFLLGMMNVSTSAGYSPSAPPTQRSFSEVARTNPFCATFPAFLPRVGSVPAVFNVAAPSQVLSARTPVASSSSSPFSTGFPVSSSIPSLTPMHSSMPSNPVAPVPQPPAIVAALSQHRVAVSSDSSLASLAVPVPPATDSSLASPVNKSENKKEAGVFSISVSRDAGRNRTFVILFMLAVFAVVGAQGAWSTAQLSLGRFYLAAASVGNVSIFAGGYRHLAEGGKLNSRNGGNALHPL